MTEPDPPTPDPTTPGSPLPGSPSPAGGEARRLDRAPGERYAAANRDAAGSGPSRARAGSYRSGAGSAATTIRPVSPRAVLAATLVATAGAVLFLVIGLTGTDIGLLVVAAFTGWLTALALVWRGRTDGIADGRLRVGVAAVLGGWVVLGGMLLDWAYARLVGGVLGPLEYAWERYGLIALPALVIAAAVAAYRAR